VSLIARVTYPGGTTQSLQVFRRLHCHAPNTSILTNLIHCLLTRREDTGKRRETELPSWGGFRLYVNDQVVPTIDVLNYKVNRPVLLTSSLKNKTYIKSPLRSASSFLNASRTADRNSFKSRARLTTCLSLCDKKKKQGAWKSAETSEIAPTSRSTPWRSFRSLHDYRLPPGSR